MEGLEELLHTIISSVDTQQQQEDEFLILPENGKRKYTYFYDSYTEEQRQEMYKLGFVRVSHEDWNKLMGNLNDGHTYYIADDGRIYDETEYVPSEEELLKEKKSKIYREYIAALEAATAYTVDGVEYEFVRTEENIEKFIRCYLVAQIEGSCQFNVMKDGEKVTLDLSFDDYKKILVQSSAEQKKAYALYKGEMAALFAG